MILTQSHNLNSFIDSSDTSERPKNQVRQPDQALLEGIIESFLDGILILTEQGDCIQSNKLARQICEQLTPSRSRLNSVPKEIWIVCQALIESRVLSPTEPIIIESEIVLKKSNTLRIRVQWFNLNAVPQHCLLVILEDRCQSSQKLAIAEVDRYRLSPREVEVWLRRRAKYTYKQIATELYISLNTVKKHIKNIHAKGLQNNKSSNYQ
ncbi:MAG TPA: helix-turn-helix transcriptional regulator [Cyanobacteria bacterium UBA8803]|nr:helix-turn-helix transcriptional regulator [Cyanobacteria bacterium UBA9273]HBL59225.1 helix-turn-helix transcriptional regulator [Cyanobacteria bacterium UBA8803]